MKLLVAEDQSMLRDALCQLLLMEDDVDEIFASRRWRASYWHIASGKMLMWLSLMWKCRKKSGLDVLEWIRKHKEMKVIIVTTF